MNYITAEIDGLFISFGIIVLGNIIKPKNKDVGNFVQGIGIGGGIGTAAHMIDEAHPDPLIPHHDKIALVSLPTIFVLDKTNFIQNKDLANNLYGISLGILAQHLLTEGCSWCGNYYCHNGEKLC